jgi:ATPase family associated with various cellular activities (AAA)
MNELLKTQMMLSLGAAKNPLLNILALNMFDVGVKTFPVWSNWAQSFCCRRKKQSNILPSSIRTPNASITCERGVSQQTQSNRGPTNTTVYQTRMDAVVHYVSTIPAMKSLLSVSHHDYLPHEFEPVQLENDVYFELQDLKINDGQVEIIKFKIFCYDHDIQHLQTFVENCNTDYERRMANKLGTHRYFFDQVVQQKVKGSVQNPLPTSHLLYTKSKFTTNRSFDNVFFEQRNDVRNRTRFFLEHRDWYDKKGIPYTLGFMFHGPPGTGKTSSVKAIAREGRRHIVNVQLSEIKTKAQLQHLFFNDEIHVYNGTNTERYTIPVSERLYVIEDIDAMGDTVLRREWKKPTFTEPKKQEGDAWMDRDKEPEKETIDLSFLLNLLDGTLEANGRILIITTNFPERIDRALIRPGRIDMIVNFRRSSREIAQEMVNSFYEREIEIPEGDIHEKWSPAEINQILFRNFENPEQAVRELVELSRDDLYGFQNESESSKPIETTNGNSSV